MIDLRNLNKNFGTTKIYSNANYTFKENKLTCILGPSGCGKTTLFNLIAGFDSDFTGEVKIDGVNIKKLSKDELCKYRFNNIGFIFQQYNLLKGYTAKENVLMALHLNSTMSDEEKDEKARKLLVELGLRSEINQKIETLSGGQKQRVAIARALINSPKIILADEPTGALDSDSSKIIMKILKKISVNKTVIIITHDEEVANYANEVIELEEFDIKIKEECKENKEEIAITKNEKNKNFNTKLNIKNSTRLSLKNFKIHIFKYIIVALIIAVGAAAFVAALASKSITNNVINDFKTKNIFYNKGQIPSYDNGNIVNEDLKNVYNDLSDMEGVENVYYQYDLKDITLKNGDKTLDIPVKAPTATSKETLAYGNMPNNDEKEIVVSSNVANRLTSDIKDLIGKKIVLQYRNKEGKKEDVTLTVSGLTNSQYQDFIVSTNVERNLYNKINIDKENPTAISFDMKEFESIPKIDSKLKEDKIGVFTKAHEIENFQKSFTSLLKLYTALSYLILVVGMIISSVMLYKISIERYTEVGLLGALGYTKKNIKQIMVKESIYFATISTVLSFLMILLLNIVYKMKFGYGLDLTLVSFGILVAINLILTIGLSNLINIKLIKTEPATALRK